MGNILSSNEIKSYNTIEKQCIDCKIKFVTLLDIESHMPLLRCPICDFTFKNLNIPSKV